jgi:hypothetical protein
MMKRTYQFHPKGAAIFVEIHFAKRADYQGHYTKP